MAVGGLFVAASVAVLDDPVMLCCLPNDRRLAGLGRCGPWGEQGLARLGVGSVVRSCKRPRDFAS